MLHMLSYTWNFCDQGCHSPVATLPRQFISFLLINDKDTAFCASHHLPSSTHSRMCLRLHRPFDVPFSPPSCDSLGCPSYHSNLNLLFSKDFFALTFTFSTLAVLCCGLALDYIITQNDASSGIFNL